LLSKLLAVPSLRARYLAHVRTLAAEALDWERTGPLVESLHRLIAEEVAKDVRKLYSTDAFLEGIEQDTESGRGSVPGLKPFFAKRREFLLAHPLIAAPRAAVASVGHASVAVDASVTVSAMVSGDVPADEVYLYHSAEFGRPFSRRAMRRGDTEGVYVGEIPAAAAGATVRYYVEARAGSDPVTSSFFPRRAEAKALSYHVSAAVGTAGDAVFPVRINEIMAQNRASVADPQGEFDDWIELYNAGDEAVDLSELYLSDDAKNPRLWRFPRGTAIAPGGYLMVWADADGTDRPGLHASFKLSREGARVLLVDADARQNHILDELLFEALETDRSLARTRDGGGFELQEATPGRENR
jgi:hypothetical protein